MDSGDEKIENKIKKYKRDFQTYGGYPIHPVVDSQPIQLDGTPYRIIGQIILSIPFFTRFQVIDNKGNEATPSVRKKIHLLISKMEIVSYLTPIKDYLKNQKEADHISDINNVAQNFLDTYGKSLNRFPEEADKILSLFNKMDALASELEAREELSSEQFTVFSKAWDSFWELYEERLHNLFIFRSYVIEKNMVHLLDNTNLNDIFNEAQVLDKLYTESMSTETPLFTSIHDLIQLNLELGYVKEGSSKESPLLTKGETFGRNSLKVVAHTFLITLIPLGIIMSITGFISYYLVLFIGIITMILYVSRMIETLQLARVIPERIKDRREKQLGSQPIIRSKYPTAYKLYQHQVKNKKDPDNEFD